MDRPITTLFLLTSLDGKISTGASDLFDFDSDFKDIEGLKEGLHQYYEIEQTTDAWCLCTGRTKEKIGVNYSVKPTKINVSTVIVDNNHLTQNGIQYLCNQVNRMVLVTSNKQHPAINSREINLNVLLYDRLDLSEVLHDLKTKFGCERITIQSGGSLNSEFLKQGLIDYVDVVIAPVIVGGKDTVGMSHGESNHSYSDLDNLSILEMEKLQVLENSYIRLKYSVKKKE